MTITPDRYGVPPAIPEGLEVRPPGRGEASAFDRRQELIDRMNAQSPAIQYALDGRTIRYEVKDEPALTNYDREMRRLIDLAEVIPMRLIDRTGYVGGNPLAFDSFQEAYVDLDDLLASSDLAFQLLMIHFLTERSQVRDYARRIGTNLASLYPGAHRAGREAEARHLRSVIGDDTIEYRYDEPRPGGAYVIGYRSTGEKYWVFRVNRNQGKAGVRGSTLFVQLDDGTRLTVEQLQARRAAARPATAPPTTPATGPTTAPTTAPGTAPTAPPTVPTTAPGTAPTTPPTVPTAAPVTPPATAPAGDQVGGAAGPWPVAEGSSPPARTGLAALESRYFPPPGSTDAAPFSRAATVLPLIDGRDYFGAVKAEIDRLAPGDTWYVTGWLFEPTFRFGPSGPTLESLLAAKAAAGVDVRVILWASRTLLDRPALAGTGLGPVLQVTRFNVAAAERLRAVAAGGSTPLAGRVLLDWSGNAASSHHMKLNVFVTGGVVTAFAGGLDFWPDRLDAPPHTSMRFLRDDGSRVPWGWHDAGVKVTGEAAQRVLDTVVTRWTEAATLSPASYDVGAGAKPFNPPPLVALTPPAPGPGSVPAPSTDTSVQVVRSIPDSKEFRGLLRPNLRWATLPAAGVHETVRTLQTALAAAARYIYVEDQSFDAVTSLFPALAAACRRGVKVIAVLPGSPDPNDGGRTPVNRVLSSEVSTGLLGALTPTEQRNLAVWRLDDITVHSKLVLIDDEFLCLGSANFMDRSMQYTLQGDDSELSVAAVSTGTLVADLRVQLWAEHLRVSTAAARAEIRDLAKSLGFWRASWGTGLAVPHPATPLAFVGP